VISGVDMSTPTIGYESEASIPARNQTDAIAFDAGKLEPVEQSEKNENMSCLLSQLRSPRML
jgi:hypothetical protein